MKRNATAVWQGTGREGKGHLTTRSGILNKTFRIVKLSHSMTIPEIMQVDQATYNHNEMKPPCIGPLSFEPFRHSRNYVGRLSRVDQQ